MLLLEIMKSLHRNRNNDAVRFPVRLLEFLLEQKDGGKGIMRIITTYLTKVDWRLRVTIRE